MKEETLEEEINEYVKSTIEESKKYRSVTVTRRAYVDALDRYKKGTTKSIIKNKLLLII
jgi:hypothetical protein